MTRFNLQILIIMLGLLSVVGIYVNIFGERKFTYHVYATYPVTNGYGKLDGISVMNYEIVDYESYIKFKNALADTIKDVKGDQVTVETLTLLKK